MDSLAPVIIFLIFLAVTFSRKSKQVQKEPSTKSIIPMVKKDPWAPDSFVTSSKNLKPIIPEQTIDEPIQNKHVDRIVAEDSFWSSNEEDYSYDSYDFKSMENQNLPDNSIEGRIREKAELPQLNRKSDQPLSIFPELASESLVQAFVMNEVLNKPSHKRNT
ncbi:MAG: hypothetical protein GX858_02715 [Clostridiales bacterium]|nr:hypothetical protein [Clostridiales bacterium]